ncbi:ParA family protein [Candidatus Similichlamydia epinepheli]|uniref:ParA family protein n=1 Tax=Candidatus Similichlamydia epinepheli TaxID=1903953 RepID=UPI000D3BEBFF|nr:ParA family protein [Candidatus Similichlamydia epinepheli]
MQKKRIMAITSFKGGTAKTSTVLHLGAGLAAFFRKKVLVIDFDAQANLTSGLGFDADEVDSLATVFRSEKDLHEVILSTEIPGLSLIPADSWLERIELTGALATDRYSHERLKQLLQEINYDWILIDTPPSLCWLTESSLIAANYALVCATPEFYSIKGLERLSTFLTTVGKRHALSIAGVTLSFWNPRGKNNAPFLEIIEKHFPGKLLKTKIRKDAAIGEACIQGKPVFMTDPKSRASKDFADLTAELVAKLEGPNKCQT